MTYVDIGINFIGNVQRRLYEMSRHNSVTFGIQNGSIFRMKYTFISQEAFYL